MKFQILLIAIILLISCKKDPQEIGFFAGSSGDATITTHDSTAQGYYHNEYSYEDYLYLDLDSDGINDIYFTSSKDTNSSTYGIENPVYIHYIIKVRILNVTFSIAEIEKSEQTYEHYSEGTRVYIYMSMSIKVRSRV